MKIQIITLLTVFALLYSCQHKSSKSEANTAVKSCCTGSTKSCCTKTKGDNKAYCIDTSFISLAGAKVIYFHNERRCATCMAVEEGAAEVVKQFADSTITFQSYLIGDPKSAEVEKKYKIEGQTLLIVGKGKVTNLTNIAFLNARVKPDTYKEILKAAIEKQK